MARCDFCGIGITKGTGKMYVKKDGKIIHFCSMKCEKNLLKLKRKPRTTGWTREFRKAKEVEKATVEHQKQAQQEAKKETKKEDKKQKKE